MCVSLVSDDTQMSGGNGLWGQVCYGGQGRVLGAHTEEGGGGSKTGFQTVDSYIQPRPYF